MTELKTETKSIQNLCVGSLRTNCWVYLMPNPGSPRHCVVIDPGADAPLIIKHLKKHDLCPKFVLLTHGHFDHITALPELVKAYPSVVAIHQDDSSYLKNKSVKLLIDGGTIGPFKVIHVPGHTPGSVAFYDEEGGILFTGDTLFNADCGRTDLAGGNQFKLIKSLERLFTMKGSIRVLPGHGSETTIAAEAARGLSFFNG